MDYHSEHLRRQGPSQPLTLSVSEQLKASEQRSGDSSLPSLQSVRPLQSEASLPYMQPMPEGHVACGGRKGGEGGGEGGTEAG